MESKKNVPSLRWVERELLDTIAFNPSTRWIAEERLTAEDFLYPEHQKWFRNLQHEAHGTPPSQATVQNVGDLAEFVRAASIKRTVERTQEKLK
jgi:replicative DNA helicase